ncbi:hypothetical protein LIER_09330 [Lithospermum erythrorhizon]|uniref:Uncharacterized protein n=1 Tax=Lithospermum erythrorhizon TaxID=34254 RepID=A0AAV3PHI4_LITER
MRGKRPIAFKKVKVVKKVASSPHPSTTAELPPRPSSSVNLTSYSSPVDVELSPSSFSPPDMDFPREPPSLLSLPRALPTKMFPKEGRSKPGKLLSSLPPFPTFDPLMVACNLQSFHTMRPLFLEGLCAGYSNSPDPLEVYGAMCRHMIQLLISFLYSQAANVGFELARRADRLEEENKDLQNHVPARSIGESKG